MKYVIIINNSPLTSQGSLSAYHFTKALIKKEHQLLSVFFYQQGAYHGSDNTILQQDEVDIKQLWASLAEQKNIPLHICSAAALRRGTIDANIATQYDLPVSMHPAYKAISLNQFLELTNIAERMISFA